MPRPALFSIKMDNMPPVLRISLLWLILTAACSPATPAAPTLDIAAAQTQAVATIFAGASQTAAAEPTLSPTPPPTAPRTPPPLPAIFSSGLLNPLDLPRSYIGDNCQALKAKWTPGNAAPGTVLMTIMFHGIAKGEITPGASGVYHDMSMSDFHRLMKDLKDQGFEAIDMQQAANFLYNNAPIPPRAVLLIVDDRKYRESFDNTFREYFQNWGWKVVNSYITLDERPDLWTENAALEAEGWVDHQAHGYIHNENITAASSEDFMRQELGKPFEMFTRYFNKTPIAYIWPGGSFTPRAAQIGRELGYRLGFTINPRGPVMFNWVPQAENADPLRPSFLPEGETADPLMTLPRYWSPDARNHIDEVRQIGQQAAAYAESNRAAEVDYYNLVCAPTYGELTP